MIGDMGTLGLINLRWDWSSNSYGFFVVLSFRNVKIIGNGFSNLSSKFCWKR